jgi:hypothetical protein
MPASERSSATQEDQATIAPGKFNTPCLENRARRRPYANVGDRPRRVMQDIVGHGAPALLERYRVLESHRAEYASAYPPTAGKEQVWSSPRPIQRRFFAECCRSRASAFIGSPRVRAWPVGITSAWMSSLSSVASRRHGRALRGKGVSLTRGAHQHCTAAHCHAATSGTAACGPTINDKPVARPLAKKS